MILDTSAIIAAIAAQPDGAQFQTAMKGAKSLAIAAITVLETRIVLHGRRQPLVAQAFDVMLQRAGIEVVPLDADLAHAAFEAFRRHGKVQRHPAQLNIADCVTYAVAKNRSDILLLKGGDFAKTDIQSAY
jgi:ribonuclease VapC